MTQLWFLSCIANPVGYNSRINLFNKFAKHILEDLNAKLCIVECAYFDHDHSIDKLKPKKANEENYIYIPVRSQSIMWHKENLLNIGIEALKGIADNICWCDADIDFFNYNAPEEINKALEKNKVVQCYTTALDTGPVGEVLKIDNSFAFSLKHNLPESYKKDQTNWHTGYVWAANIQFLLDIGGLFDKGIIGSGDRMMADAFTGRLDKYKRECDKRLDFNDLLEWSILAYTDKIGYVSLVIKHNYHGHKKDRQYSTRGQTIIDHKYIPSEDLVINKDGVYEWSEKRQNSGLAQALVKYFINRKEDH